MNLRASASLLFISCLLATAATHAQSPARGPSHNPADHPPLPPPSNLKVLPANIPIPQLIEVMTEFAQQLGVECVHCHAAKPGVDPNYDLNFASDEKQAKRTARVMMQMTGEINGRYLTQLPDPHQGPPVNCGTCHRGQAVPPTFVPPPPPQQ